MTETFRVHVVREDDWWLARIPQAEAFTEAPTLARLEREVRDVVALMLDLDDVGRNGLVFDWDIQTGDAELDQETAALRAARAELADAEKDLTTRTAQLAQRLRRAWSVRDAAALLGISPQRVAQISHRDDAAA